MSRILVSYASPTPNQFSGIAVYAWCILEALVRHGRHDYVLCTNWDRERLPNAIRDLGIPIEHNASPRNEALAILHNSLRLPGLARRHGCEAILHAHPTASLSDTERSVVVVHDLYRVTHRHLFPLRQRLQWDLFTARSLKRAAALIAVSHATAAECARAYPALAGRTHVVQEASPIPPAAEDDGRALPDPEFFLVVANLTHNKNVGVLIAAMKRLYADGMRPRVVLVGRDEFGSLPALLAGVDVDLDHRPSVSGSELRALYSDCYAYINTSLTEGFCLPVLEAHTFGVPVICSDIPVLHEVAGDAALFFDPLRPDDLAAAMRRLVSDRGLATDLRAKAIVNARRFSWQRAALETEAVLDGVIAQAGRRS